MLFFSRQKSKSIKNLEKKLSDLNKELNIATEFIESVTKGDLEKSLEGSEFVEAQMLSKALSEMQLQLQTFNKNEKQRNWAIEGQAKFGELIRKYNQDLKELSDYLLKFIIHYLEANQGGLFVLNESNSQQKYLEMQACYAYNRKKFEKKIIPIEDGYAEGLIGQVYMEGRTTYLKQVPKDYIRITSGMGDAPPSYLMLLPLKANEITYGILEIASFMPFENYQIDFLEKISEGIATSVAMVKTNEITRVLLRESQVQAAALRTQEEELRQNNEELMTTQEEMQRRGNELSSQIETINQSGIILIEFMPNGEFIDANDAFYNMFEYSIEDITGKNHNILKTSSEQKSEEQLDFWGNLSDGIAKSGEYNFLTKNKRIVWLKGGYSPILDSNGKVHKIILIAFDITESKKQLEEINLQAKMHQSQEAILKKNNEKLSQARNELEQRIEELNRFKAEEELRLKERDAKSQVWVNKLMDKSKKTEEALKAQLAEKDKIIQELENKLVKLN